MRMGLAVSLYGLARLDASSLSRLSGLRTRTGWGAEAFSSAHLICPFINV